MDYRSVLAAAPSAERIVEFDDCAGDIFERLQVSLDHAKGTDRCPSGSP